MFPAYLLDVKKSEREDSKVINPLGTKNRRQNVRLQNIKKYFDLCYLQIKLFSSVFKLNG